MYPGSDVNELHADDRAGRYKREAEAKRAANEEAPVPTGSESGQPPAFGAKGDALAGMRRPLQVRGQKSHY